MELIEISTRALIKIGGDEERAEVMTGLRAIFDSHDSENFVS